MEISLKYNLTGAASQSTYKLVSCKFAQLFNIIQQRRTTFYDK